jgi:hypothetical protein
VSKQRKVNRRKRKSGYVNLTPSQGWNTEVYSFESLTFVLRVVYPEKFK